MCGIVGILGTHKVADRLVASLRLLEYRGYDSAGISTLHDGQLVRRRAKGKLDNLDAQLSDQPAHGDIGIGHTRWATHGVPSEANAHPHVYEGVSVVHNGIIENFQALRNELIADGHQFASQTDTEVVAHLVCHYWRKKNLTPREAVYAALQRFEGAFALAILFEGLDDLMVVARRGSPLAIGHGDGEMYVGSDALCLNPHTKRVQYLSEGDHAVLSRTTVEIRDAENRIVDRPITVSAYSDAAVDKGNYRHFMLKEIHQQPEVIGDTLRMSLNSETHRVDLPEIAAILSKATRITMVACGTAYYACLVARYWFEGEAGIPVDIDVASEFRYREPPIVDGTVAIVVSQSGETADTLAALRHMKAQGCTVIAICNVPESTIAREADVVVRTLAGPEIGVASTKAFTTQLISLACMVIAAGRERGTLSAEREKAITDGLSTIQVRFAEVLRREQDFVAIAAELAQARDVLYAGRGTAFAIAMEGALKLKEISYIHAEGYGAGELKHGPIALIDDNVPVIVLAPQDSLYDKTISNLQEMAARDGQIILVSTESAVADQADMIRHGIHMPDVDPMIAPILYSLPVQLLAYYTAVKKGTDVDQPRNLAKSVTVE